MRQRLPGCPQTSVPHPRSVPVNRGIDQSRPCRSPEGPSGAYCRGHTLASGQVVLNRSFCICPFTCIAHHGMMHWSNKGRDHERVLHNGYQAFIRAGLLVPAFMVNSAQTPRKIAVDTGETLKDRYPMRKR